MPEIESATPANGHPLVRYEAARRALAEAKNFDEVMQVRDVAEAARLYARQANDTELEENAIDIRLRAERKAGGKMKEARAAGLLAEQGHSRTKVPDQNLLTIADIDVTKKQSADWAKLDALPDDEFEARLDRVKTAKAKLPTAAVLRMANVAANSTIESDGDQWCTPPEFIEAARCLMGSIDLDPASNATAQRVVKAKHFFTKDDDGLNQEWYGNIFVNPPYSYPLIEKFIAKLLTEFGANRTVQAVVLVNNCTDAGWFQKLAGGFPVMFGKKRCRFYHANREGQFGARQGQALFYLGVPALTSAFFDAFKHLAYAPNIGIIA